MGTFSAQVKDAANSSKERLRKIAATAIQDQLSRMQTPVAQGGNMPVDTSTLRNSLVSELNGAAVAKGPDSYVLAVGRMELGDTVSFLSLIHISEPTRRHHVSRMPSSA